MGLNSYVIELTQEKASEIRINTGDDDSNDEIEVASGFIRNLVGNAAQTDSYTSDVGATYSSSANNDTLIGDSGDDLFFISRNYSAPLKSIFGDNQ